MTTFKLGCDPETFCCTKTKNPEIISPALLELFSGMNYISQDPQEKHPIYILEDEYSWMQDGAAFELTVRRPFEDPSDGYKIIQTAKKHLEDFITKFNFQGKKLEIVSKPVARINPELYMKFMDMNKIYQGFIFGCDPDKDAIAPTYVCKTVDVATHIYRYGGGHLHFSTNENTYMYDYPEMAIKFLALTVGNYTVVHTKYREEDRQRVGTYGRPGRYRQQKYPNGFSGVEYRTPSNAWFSYSEEEFINMYEWGIRGLEYFFAGRDDLVEKYLPATINSITQSDPELASEILEGILNS